jgi:putative ABC transport system permease protein
VSWRDNLMIALRGINSNRLRSLLTMLGVLIGVAAVIILVAVGNGSSIAIQQNIDRLGTNTLTVFNTGRFGRGALSEGTQTQAAQLTIADVNALEDPNNAPDVASVSPVVSTSETASYGAASQSSTSVIGSTPSYLTAEDYTVSAGSPITAQDVTTHAAVVDLGAEVASTLFPAGSGVDPLGQSIQLGSATFRVVGVLASKGSSGVTNQDQVAIAPYTAVQDVLTGYSQSFSQLIVQGNSAATLDLAQAEIESVLAAQNDTTVASLPFQVINQQTLLSTAQSTSSTFTDLLAIVAGISLLVGGIGVMNIMLVTVTERTREIGIRKAIGAPRWVILSQFLYEAVLLSMLGGAAGVGVGLVGSHFRIDGVHPVVAGYSIALAFGVSIAVGIFFGFYPANRASSLRPIDALRYE